MTARMYSGDARLTLGTDSADITIQNGDLSRDESLETAILISLYTDARNIGETEFAQDVRGWWADNAAGSLLWLLERSKTESAVLGQAEDRCRTALQWLIDDGVAERFTVTVARQDTNLAITVQVFKPQDSNNPATFRYFYNWQAQLA
jgi:phage gp46-like protein